MKGLEKKARTAMETSLILIGNEAKNFFVDNFKKQGFDDKGVEKWEKRKKNERKGRGSKRSAKKAGTIRSVKEGRNILVKSGDLRRSIRRGAISKSNLSVVIATDLDYAKPHNEGNHQPQRVGFHSRATKRYKTKRRSVARKSEVKEHFRLANTPKRQFIGDSYNLNEKVKKVLIRQLDKVFK